MRRCECVLQVERVLGKWCTSRMQVFVGYFSQTSDSQDQVIEFDAPADSRCQGAFVPVRLRNVGVCQDAGIVASL